VGILTRWSSAMSTGSVAACDGDPFPQVPDALHDQLMEPPVPKSGVRRRRLLLHFVEGFNS
jgi:hypothetical protein